MKDFLTAVTDMQTSGWFRNYVYRILEMPLHELEQSPRWLRMLGLFIELPGALEDKIHIFSTIADLSPRYLELRLERCPEKEEIVRQMMEQGQQWVLVSLLTASLTRCLPETRTPADLEWLLRTLLVVKSESSQTATLRLQKGSGQRLCILSRAYWQTLCDEASLAAAKAWCRFLRSPGGTNVCGELAFVFTDRQLTEEIGHVLAEDPLLLALFLQEMVGRPGFPSRRDVEPWVNRARAAVQFIQHQIKQPDPGRS
ncbi:MAG: hypothetical protein ACOY81_01145 [Bacillota bacterium]